MSLAELTTRYTADDLLRLPNGGGYELVDGQLVERHMGAKSQFVAAELQFLLTSHCKTHGLGWVAGSEVGYRCFGEDVDRVRRPDASFIRGDRLPVAEVPWGFLTLPPDLAIEAVSPGDAHSELEEKVSEYLAAGVRLVWVIEPEAQRVYVYHPDGRGVILNRDDTLSGEDVVPGFACRVADLFAPPPGVPLA